MKKALRLSFNTCIVFLPSSYNLPNLLGCQVPNKPSSASYSFSGRRKVGSPSEDLSMSPGPAKYDTINPDIYHQRQPSFSMQQRTKRLNYSSAIPGPGSYSPEKFHVHLPRPPSFTLGVRHSEFVTPLVVDVIDWLVSRFNTNALFLFNVSHKWGAATQWWKHSKMCLKRGQKGVINGWGKNWSDYQTPWQTITMSYSMVSILWVAPKISNTNQEYTKN